MSIQHGKINLSVYRIEKNPHVNAEDLLAAAIIHAAPTLTEASNMPDGISIGWASGKVMLDSAITPENSIIDGTVVLNLRSTAKRIDPGMLKAVIQRDESAYLSVHNAEFVPRKVRKEIKEDAIDRLKRNATLGVRSVEMAIAGDWLLVGSASPKECDIVARKMASDLGIEITSPNHYSAQGDKYLSGREFLTWLHKKILWDGNEVMPGVELMIEGPLDLVADGDARCTIANLKGEQVTQSTEVREALNDKKQIVKARISLTKEMSVWKFTFDADKWTFGSLELPEDCETFADRVEDILTVYQEIDNVFDVWKSSGQSSQTNH